MWKEILGHSAAHGLPLLFLALLSKLFPSRKAIGHDFTEKELIAFRETYKKLTNRLWITLLPTMALVSVIFYYGLTWLYEQQLFVPQNTLFYVTPDAMAVGILLTIGFDFLFIMPMASLLLHTMIDAKDYELYCAYGEYEQNLDTKSIEKGYFVVLIAGILALSYTMNDWYFVVKNEELIYNELMTLTEKSYPYSSVHKLVYKVETFQSSFAPLAPKNHYDVIFDDGNTWNTGTGLNKCSDMPKLIQTIATKSGVKIDTIRGSSVIKK